MMDTHMTNNNDDTLTDQSTHMNIVQADTYTQGTKQPVEVFDEFYKFACPYCGIDVVVMKNELACKIFRCGILKKNGTQVPQHADKKQCDGLRETDSVYGCARPFAFCGEYVEPCEYI